MSDVARVKIGTMMSDRGVMVGAGATMAAETAVPTVIAPSDLEFAFLQRLASLVQRQDRAGNERARTVLAHAAFSTYLDCVELGQGDEAERILTRDPLALRLWRQGRPI
jgi:hypothetical protein